MSIDKKGVLFTIGHSQHSIGRFAELLNLHEITYLIDVRSVPYSRYTEQFNREPLQNSLKPCGIHYSFMGGYLGAKPDDPHLYGADGRLDFERVRASAKFRRGVDNILQGLEWGYNIALMCVEKDPFDCHRAILVARAFEQLGIEVNHILPDGTVQKHQALNRRLLDHYFPNREQVSFFEEGIPENVQEALRQAYKKRNAEIGHIHH